MIEVHCNICRKLLHDQSGMIHFCERCAPFAEEFTAEVMKIADELRKESNKRIERLRNQFCQTKLNPKTNLKAVGGAGQTIA